jgi:trehalose 6-phosphate phosphatase
MQHLLSQASRAVVRRLARQPTLCAFDFDGTLAPIVDHPGRAGMPDRTRTLLGRLATLYPCVIISGRARADVLGKLTGVEVASVIGNHGAEAEASSTTSRRRVSEWKAAIEGALNMVPGLWVEDKGLSLAVHYRQCSQKAKVRRQIFAAARELPQVRVFGGKQVVNLVVDQAPHKGEALAAERDRLGCSWVLYVGDDENDEDAFALDGNVVPVRIGRKRRSHARYYLRSQAEIDTLLELLVLERSRLTESAIGEKRALLTCERVVVEE